MLNKILLIGRVGIEPQIKVVGENIKVARFTFATSEFYKDQNGNKAEKTEWHNIVCWRGLADFVDKYIKKGMRLYIEGKVQYKTYEKDGQTKYYTEIECYNLQALEKLSNEQNNQQQPSQPQQPQYYPTPAMQNEQPQQYSQAAPPNLGTFDNSTGDLPF